MASLLNEDWVQRFQLEEQPRIQIAACQILHLLEDTSDSTALKARQGHQEPVLEENESRENVTRFNISMIKQALESHYVLQESNDDDIEMDDIEIDS